MFEEWRDIKGYEGLYQVSNLGRVRSLDRIIKFKSSSRFHKGQIISIKNSKTGYCLVNLHRNSKQKMFLIHRLVAQAFIDNPEDLPCVNHKDENKLNNQVDNLEWCTYQYNTSYGTTIKRIAEKLSIPILQYDLYGNFIREYNSITDATKCLSLNSRTNIWNALNGICKSSGGFIWKYK